MMTVEWQTLTPFHGYIRPQAIDDAGVTSAFDETMERSAGLYPSLHLNLGDCYRRLGDLDRAREHLELARAGMGALGDDAYGDLIRRGLDLLTRQLEP